jgi:leucyl aminopeptidase
MAGLLAVGAGSTHEPALLTLTYAPKKFEHTVALVGKGLTFDSGGLNIKTGNHMEEMKSDMAGAAAVLGAICAAAALKLPVRVFALAALAENMPGGDAYKPGDILTYANGKTVEVVNTDAEGRLALADALIAAERLQPETIIELSTLTGAVVTALGDGYAGLMCTSKRLTASLIRAAETSGELLWELPLFAEYRDGVTSRVADLKNANYGGASSIKAGIFLGEFVARTPFAHLDIAGTAFLSKSNYWFAAEGASGYGVRLLLEYLRQLI